MTPQGNEVVKYLSGEGYIREDIDNVFWSVIGYCEFSTVQAMMVTWTTRSGSVGVLFSK